MNKKNSYLAISVLAISLIGGFLFRIWGIGYGLPNNFHYDAGLAIYTAFFAASHKFAPDTFLYPMLLSNIIMAVYGIYFAIGLIYRCWLGPADFFISYLKDPTVFLLIGRLFIVSVDVANIFLIYYVGKKVYRERVGLISAFLLAFTFLQIKESHYLEEDLILGLQAVAGLYFAYLISLKGRRKDYLISGAIVGLAWATKYNFFVFIPRLIFAHILWLRKKVVVKKSLPVLNGFKRILLGRHLSTLKFKEFITADIVLTGFVAVLVFLAADPYVVFWPGRAFSGVIEEFQTATTKWVTSEGLPIWLYYLTHHLLYGMGWPLMLLSVTGFFYLSFRSRRAKDLLLIINPFSFFLTLLIFGGQNFARFIVMVTPSLVMMAAIFMDRITAVIMGSKTGSNIFLAVFCLLAVVPSVRSAAAFDYYLSRPDTRNLAKDWIESTIPAESKIVNEGAARSEYPSIFGPPIMMSGSNLIKRLSEVNKIGEPGEYLKALIKAREGKKGYDLIGTVMLNLQYVPEKKSYVEIPGVDSYVKSGYCYLVTSTWAGSTSGKNDMTGFQASLEKNYDLIKEITPNPEFPRELYEVLDYSVLEKVKIFDPSVIAGPKIEIWKMKDKEKCP